MSGVCVNLDLRAARRCRRTAPHQRGLDGLMRVIGWEALFNIMLKQGYLLDRWDFIDLGLWKIADFMARTIEPGEELVEVEL
jgi:hypothetical protein